MHKRATGGRHGRIVLFLAAALFAASAGAATGLSGSLYTRTTTDFSGFNDRANAVAVQADGYIVVAGFATETDGSTKDFAVARYTAAGALDTSFGANGKVVTPFAGGNAVAEAVVIQPDGKIVVAGFATNSGGTTDFALARYNSDGSLDTDVNTGFNAGGAGGASPGTVITDFGANLNDSATAVALQPDGKIVVAGYTDTGTAEKKAFAVARYNADGSLDSAGFNSSGSGGAIPGTVITNLGSGNDDQAYSVVVQPDKKIVVSGYTTQNPPSGSINANDDFALARYNSDGTLDATGFGMGGTPPGTVTTSLNTSFDETFGVALQPDGKIVVAGQTENFSTSNKEFALARYTAAGALDANFGTSGVTTTSIVGPNDSRDTAQALAVQPDGKIVAAGFSSTVGSPQIQSIALDRYNEDGSLDTTFNAGGTNGARPGTRLFDFGLGTNKAQAVALTPDGKIVVAGFAATATTPNPDDFALLQYYATDDPAGWGLAPSATANFADSYELADPQNPTTATSGLLTVAGLGTAACTINVTDCVNVPVIVSGGAYAKNGSTAYSTQLGWAKIADQFNLQQTIPAAASHGYKTTATLTMGGLVAANNYAVVLGPTTQYTFTSWVDQAPMISGSPATSVKQDTIYTFTPTASDPDGDPLTFTIDNPPTWASFDATTGTLSGTPASQDVGTSPNILITVKDSFGASATLPAFSITVSTPPAPPPPAKKRGGGPFDPVTLSLLAAAAGVRRLSRRTSDAAPARDGSQTPSSTP